MSTLDPLAADAIIASLPAMNAAKDIPALARALRELSPAPTVVGGLSLEESLAAMRDVGLLLGSLKRHGAEPRVVVPEVERTLLALADRTDMIPRDTIHHYTEWNPAGIRQRMYTADPQETFLISAVRTSLPPLGDAIRLCQQIASTEPAEPGFAAGVEELAVLIGAFDEAIKTVARKVRPEFFARKLRPYFEELDIAGQSYLGPAAAHVPLFLVDLMAWASDRGDDAYGEFIDHAALHTLPHWSTLARQWRRGPSLATRVTTALRDCKTEEASPELVRAASGLERVLRALVSFRGKHLTVARRAYAAGRRARVATIAQAAYRHVHPLFQELSDGG